MSNQWKTNEKSVAVGGDMSNQRKKNEISVAVGGDMSID
jgi:hypothetical protein